MDKNKKLPAIEEVIDLTESDDEDEYGICSFDEILGLQIKQEKIDIQETEMDVNMEQSNIDKELCQLVQLVKSRESDFSTQETDFDLSQESVVSSDDEDRLTIDDVLDNTLFGCFENNLLIQGGDSDDDDDDDDDDALDRLLADSQEQDFIQEPDCIIKLQQLVDDETYKVIDITDSDDEHQSEHNGRASLGQRNHQGVKVKQERVDDQDMHQEQPSSSETFNYDAYYEHYRSLFARKRKRESDDEPYKPHIPITVRNSPSRKISLRPRTRVYWNESNMRYLKEQENILKYWQTQKELSKRKRE